MSRGAQWTARVCGALGVLFLLFDTVMHISGHPSVAEAEVHLGIPTGLSFGLGILEAVLLALYLIPRTALLGAFLWTGFLGGAVMTQLRVGNPPFTHILFPTYIAGLLWISLYLREPRLRALLPFRTER